MTIINKLYEVEGNKTRKVFRALGLQLATKYGVHTIKQVQLKRVTNEIGNLVALGYVKVYVPKSAWNAREITLTYAGLTNKGWLAWLKDSAKHGYFEMEVTCNSAVKEPIALTPNHSIVDAFVALFDKEDVQIECDVCGNYSDTIQDGLCYACHCEMLKQEIADEVASTNDIDTTIHKHTKGFCKSCGEYCNDLADGICLSCHADIEDMERRMYEYDCEGREVYRKLGNNDPKDDDLAYVNLGHLIKW